MSREDVQLANAVSELQFLHGEPDRILGTVYASSGFRYVDIPDFSLEQSAAWSEVLEARKKTTTPEGKESKTLVQRINGRTLQWGLNWALIKITHPRSVRNVLAKISSSVKMKKNSEVTAYQHLDAYKGYDVAKIGWTSGWTTGKVNAIGSHLCQRKDTASVVPILFGEGNDRFDDVVLVFGFLADGDLGNFLAGGDSGCVVLLNQETNGEDTGAVAVGLGFGGNDGTRAFYMAPMPHVIRNIQKIIGTKVVGFEERGAAEGRELYGVHD
jgi:hypothetical protein